jgi:hypothetical protein
LDLVERADRGGLIDQCARAYDVEVAVVRHHVAETLAYWTVGPGSGRRRRNWLRTVRSRLLELHKAGRLVMPVTDAVSTPDPAAEADAIDRQRRLDALIAKKNADAEAALARSGKSIERDVSKLTEGIG